MQNVVLPAAGGCCCEPGFTVHIYVCKGTRIYCKTMIKPDYFEFFYKKVGQNVGG